MIETGKILNKHGMMHNNPWHFMSNLPLQGNSFYYVDAILNDVKVAEWLAH